MNCPGGNTTEPIWRVLASSDGISSWTPLKPQHSNPNPLANQLWCIDFHTSHHPCSFEPEIIKIGQSSHKMYSNIILNFQESTTILNACTKKSGNLLNTLRICLFQLPNWFYGVWRELVDETPITNCFPSISKNDRIYACIFDVWINWCIIISVGNAIS